MNYNIGHRKKNPVRVWKEEYLLERVGHIVREPTARRQLSLLKKMEIRGWFKVKVKGGWQVVHQKDVPAFFGPTTNPTHKTRKHSASKSKGTGVLVLAGIIGVAWLLSRSQA